MLIHTVSVKVAARVAARADARVAMLGVLLWRKWGLFKPQGIQALKSSTIWYDSVTRRGVLRL